LSANVLPSLKPEPDLSGRKLGDYQVLRRLGRGAMAEVYLAEQISLGRQVALKILKRELANDEMYVKRFQNEARAAASLVHANIVQIFEVGSIEGHYYISQEYVAGQNLGDYLTRRGSVELPLAMLILRQTTAALHKASERGIVHRDIKPENILLTREGEVKVADFGLARVVPQNQTQALALTQIGITMGTPLYMSPEQVEGRALDSRSDLYSLGITMYHLLTGQPPFRGDNPLTVAVQHLKTTPERLEHLRPDLPAGLCRIMHRLLSKKPEERFQTPRALLVELRALHRELPDVNWDDEINDWSSAELLATSDARLEATQQLDQLMKTQALLLPQRSSWRGAVLGLIGALAIGAAVAWFMRPGYLLERDSTGLDIDRKKSASEQYAYALLYDQGRSIDAWRSVGEYFPNDPQYQDLAKMQLAWLSLEQKQYDMALPMYQELAARPEEMYQLRGLAGQAVIYFANNQTNDFKRVWTDLGQRRQKLEEARKPLSQFVNPELIRLLDEIQRKL
jgi:serine/threonine protein kinase